MPAGRGGDGGGDWRLQLTARSLPSGRADRGGEAEAREERGIFANAERSVRFLNAPVPGLVSPALFHGENMLSRGNSNAVQR